VTYTEALDRIGAIESRMTMLRVTTVGGNGSFSSTLATAVDRFGNGPTHISEPQDGSGKSIQLPEPESADDPGAARIRSGITASSGVSAATAASAYTGGSTASKGLTPELRRTFEQLSAKYGVPVGLSLAVARAESGFRSDATSPAGAQGLMQLMPSTARGLGVTDPYDPAQSAEGGIKYLKGLLGRFHGDAKLALAAYNAGPNAVARYGGVPPYAETQAYVGRVLGYAKEFGYVPGAASPGDQVATTGTPAVTA
jgi:hypothetical protein